MQTFFGLLQISHADRALGNALLQTAGHLLMEHNIVRGCGDDAFLQKDVQILTRHLQSDEFRPFKHPQRCAIHPRSLPQQFAATTPEIEYGPITPDLRFKRIKPVIRNPKRLSGLVFKPACACRCFNINRGEIKRLRLFPFELNGFGIHLSLGNLRIGCDRGFNCLLQRYRACLVLCHRYRRTRRQSYSDDDVSCGFHLCHPPQLFRCNFDAAIFRTACSVS